MAKDILVKYLTRHVDDRGDLAEIWRLSWELLPPSLAVHQIYTVFDPAPNTVRAYHRHEHLWDLFCILTGSAKFHIVRGPDKFPVSPTGVQQLKVPGYDDKIITLSARKPGIIAVPPLWWHGWMSLEPDTTLLSIASHEYNADKPDEERIHWEAFGGGVWQVENK